LDRDNWFAQYILGNVQRDVRDYELACETFRTILRKHSSEFVVALSLAQTLMAWAYSCLRSGEFSKSVELATEGVMTAASLIEDKEELSEAWKLLGDGAYLASLVQVEGSVRLAEYLSQKIFNREEMSGADAEEPRTAQSKFPPRPRLLECNLTAMEKMVELTAGDRLAQSAAHFNVGLAKYRLLTATTKLTESSVRPILECFKKAIQSEPRNFEYWNALGVVTATHFPSVAEKAFSRSLQINERVTSRLILG